MQKISLCFILIAASSSWADDADRWTPAEMMKGRTIGVVAPSPDGKRVAWSESRAVMTVDLSVYQSILFCANTDGSDRRRMTFGRSSAANPRWSPDGKWIAFTHTVVEEKTQLAVMRGDGGSNCISNPFDEGDRLCSGYMLDDDAQPGKGRVHISDFWQEVLLGVHDADIAVGIRR